MSIIKTSSMSTDDIIYILFKAENKVMLRLSIEVLDLSSKVSQTLLKYGVDTIGDMVNNWRILPSFGNLGMIGIGEITDKLNILYQKENLQPTRHTSANPAPDLKSFPKRSLISKKLTVKTKTQTNKKTPNVKQPHYLEIDKKLFTQDARLSTIPIEELGLPLRAFNSLKRGKINTVYQVCTKWEEIKFLKNIGPQTYKSIQTALTKLQNSRKSTNKDGKSFIQNEKTKEPDIAENIKLMRNKDENRVRVYPDFITTERIIAPTIKTGDDENLNALFGDLDQRTISIIEFRYGLMDGNKATVEETAKQFGVTAARIWGIEKQALVNIKKQFSSIGQSILYTKIKEKIDARGGLISKSRMVDELPNTFLYTGYSMEGIMELVIKISDREINLNQEEDEEKIININTLSGWSTSHYNKYQILRASDKILEILSDVKSPMQWEDLFSALNCEDGLFTLGESLAHAIILCMSDNQQIQRQTDGGWAKYKKPNRYTRVLSVMNQIGHPAHFSEIAEMYNHAFPDSYMTAQNIISAMTGQDGFVRVGWGEYGLAEWGLQPFENIPAYRLEEILKILRQHPPLKINEIHHLFNESQPKNQVSLITIRMDLKKLTAKIWKPSKGLYTINDGVNAQSLTQASAPPIRISGYAKKLDMVLREIGKPAHFDEVVFVYNQLFPNESRGLKDIKRGLYNSRKTLVNFGSGIFGLPGWEAPQEISSRNKRKNNTSIINQFEKVLNILTDANRPMQTGLILERYNQLYADDPMQLQSLYRVFKLYKETFVKPSKGVYGLRTWNINPRKERLIATLQTIGDPSKIKTIMEKHNEFFPEQTLSYAETNAVLFQNKDAFIRVTRGIFSITPLYQDNKLAS